MDQYEALLNCIFSKKLMDYVFEDYVFLPEVNTNGDIHIHGMYLVKDKIKYYKWFLPACKQWGFVMCKQGKVDEKWETYIYKDIFLMIDMLPGLPVPLNPISREEYSAWKEVKVKTTMRLTKKKYIRHKGKITDYFK